MVLARGRGRGGRGRLARDVDGDTALVRVNGVRDGSETDEGRALDGRVTLEMDRVAKRDSGVLVGDDWCLWSGGSGAVAVKQVRRREDLGVVVVHGAVTAEPTAAVQNRSVREEDGEGVVDADDVVGLQGHEGVVVRVVDLGDELDVTLGFVEGFPVDLAAGDEYRAVWEDDRGVEDALVEHAAVGRVTGCAAEAGNADLGLLVGLAECDEVGVAGAEGAVVELLAAEGEDLAGGSVEHDGVTGGGVLVVETTAGGLDAADEGALLVYEVRVEPEHVLAGAGVEDGVLLPAEEPGVVVVAQGLVVGVDVVGFDARESLPAATDGVVDLAVLGGVHASAPGAADGEDAAV